MWPPCGALRAVAWSWARVQAQSRGAGACSRDGGASYTQGQSPEPRTREYFYYVDHQGQLFLDDSKMKNFTTCFKGAPHGQDGVLPPKPHPRIFVRAFIHQFLELTSLPESDRPRCGNPAHCMVPAGLWDMAPGALALLALLLLPPCGLPPRAAGCPAACRCYSATVECGALRLRVVPPGIPPGTQTLFLQDNSITRLEPGALAPLAALRRLYLHNNSLRALEAGAFRAQPCLLELALTRNRLRGLRGGAFVGLAQLRVLYLAGNQLARLLDFTFLHLPRLQELHLQENSIELLEDQALAGLSSLALLDLSRNQLGTISRETLQPLASLQVLRLTENPWRCDCALHWLGAWIKAGGRRLLGPRDRRVVCAEPPRLALRSLLDVSGNSLVCIPPSVHVEPLELTANLGEDLRVACQASGYPQPLVTWRKAPLSREALPPAQAQARVDGTEPGAGAVPDTGSGVLLLTNITLAHAGRYECEAANAGGAARVPFRLLVNASRPQPPRPAAPPPAPARPTGREPPPEAGSMAFRALGLATQTAVAAAIALLALTALLLAAMICRRRRRRKKAAGPPGEGALFVNDYSDGPCSFAQLEELRGERGHAMFVIDRSKPLFAGPAEELRRTYELRC